MDLFELERFANLLPEDVAHVEGVGHLVDLGGDLGHVDVEAEPFEGVGDVVEQADAVGGEDVDDVRFAA